MTETPARTTYCIQDWSRTYESDRTREVKDATWFKLSNRLDGDLYLSVIDHQDGAAHWGCWVALCMIGSRANPRGYILRDDGDPHTPETIARKTRITFHVVKEAIVRFEKMNLLVVVAGQPFKSKLQKITEQSKINGSHDEPMPVVDAGFQQWWLRWLDGTKRGVGQGKAKSAWDQQVESMQDRRQFEACFISYLRSGDVARGAAMNPARWITENAKDGWSARWPELQKSRADRIEENLERKYEV